MKMNYFVVGTNDMGSAKAFYDALFAQSELQCLSPSDRMTYWVGEDFAFAAAIPFDTQPATNGNGTMVGFCVGGVDDVK
jgi:predicted enzyme related to lactoylglutathione lyase